MSFRKGKLAMSLMSGSSLFECIQVAYSSDSPPQAYYAIALNG